MASPKSTAIAALRRQLTMGDALAPAPRVTRLGIAAIDAALPWGGLPGGAIHEVTGPESDGAATGFCTTLLARLSAGTRPVLWVTANDDLYAPGLAAFGLSPERLIVVRARRTAETFWTIEEALRCRSLAAVLGEVRGPTRTVARRLQLVARGSGVTAVLLRHDEDDAFANAVTRWHVVSARRDDAAEDDSNARWRVDLVRCRGRIHGEEGYVARWLIEWRAATGDFGVVADLRDRPDRPAPTRMAR